MVMKSYRVLKSTRKYGTFNRKARETENLSLLLTSEEAQTAFRTERLWRSKASEGVVLGAIEGSNEGDCEEDGKGVGQGDFEADGKREDVDWQYVDEVYMVNVKYLSDGKGDDMLQATRDKLKSSRGKYVKNYNIDANRERMACELENDVWEDVEV
ncbi:hypothetical protein J1N35_014703 [Gossypium stocksii]|uniref:Uncharacterized protein n=1 Tax=Gossypium stocksii TaxID=47602 RepID=A0A9D3VVG2_9ROSI|nr:hypothetical protein J1N35_014703 [Gossypium stocksii]